MKRISFFLTLVFTAALGSLFVASAQDADEPTAAPAGEAPADEAPPADAAPADEAPPADAAPGDDAPPAEPAADEPEGPAMAEPADEPEAPAMGEPTDEPEAPAMDEPEAPAMDEPEAPAMDEPEAPAADEPTDEPEGPAMAEPADEPPMSDAAPEDVAPAEAAPAPAPAAKPAGPLSSLRISDGEAELERQTPNAEPLRARIAKGQAAGLTKLDTALLGADAGGVARFGGCEVTLSEHTTFKVLSVGAEVSIVEILGIELEMTRGTILEAAFGSLSVNVVAGSTTARNNSGVTQTLQMNVGGSSYTVSVPASAPGSTAPAISVDANGNVSCTVPITITVSINGGPPTQVTVQPGTPIQGGSGTAAILAAAIAGNNGAAFDSGSGGSSSDGPPAGTVPGTTPASSGIQK